MTQVTILLEPSVALFYSKIAKNSGIPIEQVLADSLFLLAGELSCKAMEQKKE